MAPSFASRDPEASSRMRLQRELTRPPSGDPSGFATHETVFIIGNKAFFVALKKAVDAAGGFAIVGAFRMDDLQTSLRRSKLLGQTPTVAVIHEPPGGRTAADDAAHGVLANYPGCGIVLISGDTLDAETERRMGVHDFNAIVLPDSIIKNPKALGESMHTAIAEAGSAADSTQQIA